MKESRMFCSILPEDDAGGFFRTCGARAHVAGRGRGASFSDFAEGGGL